MAWHSVRFVRTTFFVACSVLAVCGAARAADNEATSSELFRKLLENPADPEINYRIGQKDEAAGRPFRALAAYERGLTANPSDQRFIDAIRRIRNALNKGKTEYTVAAGMQVESNVKREPNYISPTGDGAPSLLLRVKDDSPFPGVDGMRLETNAVAYLNYHTQWRAGDLGFLGFDTGPTLALDDSSSLRIAPGASAAFAGENSMINSLYSRFEYRNKDIAKLNVATAILGYDSYGANYGGRSGYVADLKGQFLWGDLLLPEDALSVTPRFRYQNANVDKYAHGLYEVAVVHLTPTAPGFSIGPTLTLNTRRYNAPDDGVNQTRDRVDYGVTPGVQFIAGDFEKFKNLNVIGNYRYERNWSNERAKSYQNHFLGATAAFGF